MESGTQYAPVLAAMRVAGRLIASSRAEGVRSKGFQDFVTDADMQSERILLDALQEAFPGDRVLSEESASRVDYGPRLWAVDPVDGTANLAARVGFFAVSVGLLVDGHPEFAAVYDPTRDEMFSAQRGKGAWLDQLAIQAVPAAGAGANISSGMLTELARTRPRAITELAAVAKLRNLGSQALALCYVACGRMSVAISRDAKLWDDAAASLIVLEAGGRYSNFAGESVFPLGPGDPRLDGSSMGSVAGAPHAHETAAGILATPAD